MTGHLTTLLLTNTAKQQESPVLLFKKNDVHSFCIQKGPTSKTSIYSVCTKIFIFIPPSRVSLKWVHKNWRLYGISKTFKNSNLNPTQKQNTHDFYPTKLKWTRNSIG